MMYLYSIPVLDMATSSDSHYGYVSFEVVIGIAFVGWCNSASYIPLGQSCLVAHHVDIFPELGLRLFEYKLNLHFI